MQIYYVFLSLLFLVGCGGVPNSLENNTSFLTPGQASFSESADGELASPPSLIVLNTNVLVLEGESIVLTGLLVAERNDTGSELSIQSFTQGVSGGMVDWYDVGAIKYTPQPNYNGTDSFTYVVRASEGASVVATVNINVEAISDMPQITGEDIIIGEDESILLMGLVSNNVLGLTGGADLRILGVQQGAYGVVSLLNNDILKYKPQADFFGLDSFSYTVSDGNGVVVDGVVNVRVLPVNDVPIALGELVEILEEESFLFDSLLDNDSDKDGDKLNIASFSSLSDNGGLVELVGENTLRYTPGLNYSGRDSFSYVISDGKGGEARAAVIAYVKDVNDAPVVVGEEVVALQDESVVLSSLLQNDTDIDSDLLFISSFTQQSEQGGVLELVRENVLRYTPPTNFSGGDSFSYFVSDGQSESVEGLVKVNVQAVNDVLVVSDESVEMWEDDTLLLDGLLGNDEGGLFIENYTQGEAGGVVEAVGSNTLRYVPLANFNGIDKFSYLVSNGEGDAGRATITITVKSVNDIPLAKADTFAVMQNAASEINVLSNDLGLGDQVRVSVISAPQYGDLSVFDRGVAMYTPDADYFGSDGFVYQIEDADGDVSVATASLEVECVSGCTQTFSLSWEASTSANVTGYRVYYSQDITNLDRVVTLGAVMSYDHRVDAKGEYHFAVSAVNEQGDESELTGIISGRF